MADIGIEFVGKQLQNIQAELREMKFAAEVERAISILLTSRFAPS